MKHNSFKHAIRSWLPSWKWIVGDGPWYKRVVYPGIMLTTITWALRDLKYNNWFFWFMLSLGLFMWGFIVPIWLYLTGRIEKQKKLDDRADILRPSDN